MKLWNWANAVTNKSQTAKGTGLLNMLARANEQSLEATGMGNMALSAMALRHLMKVRRRPQCLLWADVLRCAQCLNKKTADASLQEMLTSLKNAEDHETQSLCVHGSSFA